MTKSKRVLATALAGTTLLFASGASHGLGFGKPVSRAILGDTLWITVPLRLEVGEEITDECLAAEVFFGDDKVAASAVSASLMSGPGDERILRVSTTALVSEPIVTVYMAAGCQARITRKFIAFADPPVLNQPNLASGKAADVAEAVSMASMPVPNMVSAPSALSAAAQPVPRLEGRETSVRRSGSGKRSKALAGAPIMTVATVATDILQTERPSKRAKASSGRKVASSKHQARHQAPVLAKLPAKAPVDAGGRLELDPVGADAMFTPALRMSSTLGSAMPADDQSANVQARRSAAAAIWLALNATPEQMARDQQRLRELEQRLAQLKQEGEHVQANGVALQTQVKQAQDRTRTGQASWLFGLLALAGVGAALYLWRQLREEKKRTEAWWQSENQAMDQAPLHAASVPAPVETSERSASSESASVIAPSAVQLMPEPVPPTAPAPIRQEAVVASARPHDGTHNVSVEELIDLERQAEFFAVLGQDDAAIGLLEGHVQHTRGGSPLPFLKLLEAYHRVGQRADFDRVGADFKQRFEALPPDWDADQQQGRSLADYPDMVASLQTMWMTPRDAMLTLDKTLTNPEPGSVIFDLPAYRELLFLYAVARDLSERDVQDRSSVDLLLPVLDTSFREPPNRAKESARADSLMSTRPNKAMPQAAPKIEIDLPLDDLPEHADLQKH